MAIDHTDFKINGKANPAKKDAQNIDRQWWKAEDKDRAYSISAVVKFIAESDRPRQAQYLTSMRLYGNMNPAGLMGFGVARSPAVPLPQRDRLTYNVVQAAGDTVTAKIAKNKPKAMFLTSGGSYKLQRKAKKLDKFVEGVMYENDAYHMGPQVMTDAYVFGDGFTQVYADNGRVKFDRVLAGELLVDWKEAIYGMPRQLHRIKEYDREVLLALFPQKAKEINEANNISIQGQSLKENISDQINVIESWHLPSGKDAGDGMHAITILDGAELLSDEWTKDYFPFAGLKWSKRQIGYWGQGGAEQVQPIQLEINKILWTIQRSYQLSGSFKIWMKIGSKIVREHLNNEVGSILESDERPEYMVPPIVPPEMYNQLKELKNSAFEQIGVSQLSANSQKPAGLDSGKALRTMNNIESERFMILGQAYEHYFLQLSRLTVDCAREIYLKTGKLSVKSPNSKFIESIDWKDVDLDDEDMISKMFPVSSLPNDPSDRMQTIQEWVQAGWVTPRTAKRIMNFPDLEAVEDLENAKEDYLHMVLEKIIDDGEYTPPEPFDDLPLAKDLFLQYYAYSKCNGVEEEKLEMLRNFNEQIDILVQMAAPPPLPDAQSGQAPQANPLAPPTSALLQNTPSAA